ncbi:hypothetical protein K7R23_07910 [Citrobacter rodentium NBRC 105723 = DSM 16636]|uniref:Uncharacterized protein n=1 Tax=Citrobacter rodentium TaxID=67825 RepID=A0A482PH44_CITRO|nr:hypothetical protein [Citrobacter rodentium]QBY30055.1 hypothetical protein E2R62_15180 [Citrobacter rodentium]UHO32562.1 hypothetical protein K7R23_07910 [Citrobacter rodentium NBRC 105723 = DSM 16636]HAT8014403.1 hypothetical protein [Citrobacter rodentium NBRC 105723 = DSM 16636]HAT8019304.1 hypothetical protein [Citrobacter rodentium]HAT8029003.1 hypothetical protein [Citrobacter rodentium]
MDDTVLFISVDDGGFYRKAKQLSFFTLQLCYIFSVILIAFAWRQCLGGNKNAVTVSTKENNRNGIIKYHKKKALQGAPNCSHKLNKYTLRVQWHCPLPGRVNTGTSMKLNLSHRLPSGR